MLLVSDQHGVHTLDKRERIGEPQLICDTCQGTRYPLQCRNSRAWRNHKEIPNSCPHGLPLGYSPDGRKRGDYAAPQGALRPEAGASAAGIWRGADPCRYLVVVPIGGCCDNEFYCAREGRIHIEPGRCAECPYKEIHEPADPTVL